MNTEKDRKIYTISEVNYFAKQTLEQMDFWVEGEISTFKKNPNWSFYYLDLKDENALLPCIASGHIVENLGEDIVGQKVLAHGLLTLYEPLGKFQFRIQTIEIYGEGLLQKKLEELIKKLKAEGLFDQQHKKEIPEFPRKVCLVTSIGSDAYNDFIAHSINKFPIIELYCADVRVQGTKSIPELLSILPKVDTMGFDAIVLTRGGGSLEDLAAFNDEDVARTVFKMKTPIVVAIGHEANESLAEWVADMRASTPTAAANVITAGYQHLSTALIHIRFQLKSKADYYFTTNFQKLDHYYFALHQTKIAFKDLPHRLTSAKESLKRHEKYLIVDANRKLADLFSKLTIDTKFLFQNQKQNLVNINKSLRLLSPKNTLRRGYSIATDTRGQIVKSVASVVVGDIIGVRLIDGQLKTAVHGKKHQ